MSATTKVTHTPEISQEAARDLLESLKNLVRHCWNGAWPGVEQRAEVIADVEQAEAAIAKVEGRG